MLLISAGARHQHACRQDHDRRDRRVEQRSREDALDGEGTGQRQIDHLHHAEADDVNHDRPDPDRGDWKRPRQTTEESLAPGNACRHHEEAQRNASERFADEEVCSEAGHESPSNARSKAPDCGDQHNGDEDEIRMHIADRDDGSSCGMQDPGDDRKKEGDVADLGSSTDSGAAGGEGGRVSRVYPAPHSTEPWPCLFHVKHGPG